MATITLKIHVGPDQVRTLKFGTSMTVEEALLYIKDKTKEGTPDHGLYQPEGKQPARWLKTDREMAYYNFSPNVCLCELS